ncbi:BolA family transcriptional regulator [Rhizobium sp. L1K21]|uniref:BolA family protein n=1 Tax=Rhizobium sp. L1K21 TaxID=2954933 RepID=UPI002092DB3F|nr:BolA family protein [Rhizobium sp. L1K21]MCO6188149.1 BolA family transcriptional regulator [Rhizobium sp. L1K21]
MTRQENIESALQAAFHPERLFVINESHLHAGHRPPEEEGPETHMRVRIVSAAFEGMGRVARHRAINDALNAEFKDGLHALAVEAAAPGEPTRW